MDAYRQMPRVVVSVSFPRVSGREALGMAKLAKLPMFGTNLGSYRASGFAEQLGLENMMQKGVTSH